MTDEPPPADPAARPVETAGKPPVGYPTLRRKVRRDVRRRWRQLAAVAGAALLGVALLGATVDAYRNLTATYDAVSETQGFADLWVSGGDTSRLAAEARATKGVADVRPRTSADVPMSLDGHRMDGRVVGYPATGQPAVNALTLAEGGWLSGPDGALVEQHVADHLGVGPGDTVTVRGVTGPRVLQVEGVVVSTEYLWPARGPHEPLTSPGDFGAIFVAERTARAVAGVTEPDQLLVRLHPPARERGDVVESLAAAAARLDATEVLTRDSQPSHVVLTDDLAGLRRMSVVFPLLFLVAAGLTAYVLLTRQVMRERPLVGMLRAAGARRRTIVLHYVGAGVLAGGIGAVGGLVLGAVAAQVLTDVYVAVEDLPEAATVAPPVRPLTLLGGLVVGLLTGAVAGGAPGLRASRIPPGAGEGEPVPLEGGRPSWAERVLPPLRRAPARWRMVLRGPGRDRRRTAFAATGVALTLLLVVTSWTTIDSMHGLLRTQFDDVARQDAQVRVAGGADRAALDALTGVPGVAAAEPLVERPVAVVSGDEVYGTSLRAFSPDTRMHGFRAPDGRMRDLPRDGLLLGVALRDRLGLRVGDDVTLRLPGLDSVVRAPVAGFVDEPLGTFAYTRADWLSSAVGDVPADTALLRLEPGAVRGQVRQDLTALDEVVAYSDGRAPVRVWDDYAGLVDAFLGGVLALGGLLAFGVVLTTMSVNVLERRRELTALRTAGVRAGSLARLLTAEHVMVTLLGVVPGLALGVGGAALLLRAYTTDQVRPELVVRPETLLLAAGAVTLVSLASLGPALRAARHADPAEAGDASRPRRQRWTGVMSG